MHYPEMEQSNLVITGFTAVDSTPALTVSGIRSTPMSPGMAQCTHFLLLRNFHQRFVSILILSYLLCMNPFAE